MKKIIAGLLFIFSVAISNPASAQSHRKTFRYYPHANVYYNNQTHQYAYSTKGNWAYRKNLPNYKFNHRSYVTVYGDNDEIWRQNRMHREKYKDWDKKQRAKYQNKNKDREKD